MSTTPFTLSILGGFNVQVHRLAVLHKRYHMVRGSLFSLSHPQQVVSEVGWFHPSACVNDLTIIVLNVMFMWHVGYMSHWTSHQMLSWGVKTCAHLVLCK